MSFGTSNKSWHKTLAGSSNGEIREIKHWYRIWKKPLQKHVKITHPYFSEWIILILSCWIIFAFSKWRFRHSQSLTAFSSSLNFCRWFLMCMVYNLAKKLLFFFFFIHLFHFLMGSWNHTFCRFIHVTPLRLVNFPEYVKAHTQYNDVKEWIKMNPWTEKDLTLTLTLKDKLRFQQTLVFEYYKTCKNEKCLFGFHFFCHL